MLSNFGAGTGRDTEVFQNRGAGTDSVPVPALRSTLHGETKMNGDPQNRKKSYLSLQSKLKTKKIPICNEGNSPERLLSSSEQFMFL